MIKDIIREHDKYNLRATEWDVRGNQKLSIELVQNLDDTLEAHEDLYYLCSNELGYKERAIDLKFSDDTYIFMNPLFNKRDDLVLSREHDRLSGKEYIIPRYSTVEIVFQDCLGSNKVVKLVKDAAIIMCQAMDTIDGIFASDYGLEILPEFDQATKEEQTEVIEAYLNSLQESYKKLDEELSNDKEVGDAWKAAKFTKAIADGSVELDNSNNELSNRKKKKIERFVKQIKQKANKLKFWRKK